MKKLLLFCLSVYKNQRDNGLASMANALSFKLILSIFPFIIFLMTLLGYLEINITPFISNIELNLPNEIIKIFNLFLEEVIYTKNFSVLSTSFILAIYTASSGFRAAIKGLNRTYEQKETRSFIRVRLICILLVIIFAFLIYSSLLLLIFSDKIYEALLNYNLMVSMVAILNSLTSRILMILLMFVMICLIYKLAVCKKQKFYQIIPGSLFSIAFWLLLSKLFNLYINNFSKYSTIYGSIGGIFVLLYWLNLLSMVFLIGGQINALLLKGRVEK